jgi:hypothetical protein
MTDNGDNYRHCLSLSAVAVICHRRHWPSFVLLWSVVVVGRLLAVRCQLCIALCPSFVLRLVVGCCHSVSVVHWCVILHHLSSSVVVVSPHGVATALAHIMALPKGGGRELVGLPLPFPSFPLERGDVAMATSVWKLG